MSDTPTAVVESVIPGADGVELFVRRAGHGEPMLVFLHGGPGGDMNDGGFDLEPLAERRTLFLYDQRGMGRSQLVSDPSQLTAIHHVRDLEALRAHFGLERMVLIGLSWGAGLAVLYAAEHPEHVSKLLLVSPMPPAFSYIAARRAATRAVLSPEELARLAWLQEQLPVATDDAVQALFHEFIELISRAYFVKPAGLSLSRGNHAAASAAALRNFRTVNQVRVSS
jgi:proline iminopeptidase